MALTRLAAKPWPLQAIRRAHSSHVDSALADALQRAARRVQKIDPTATVVPRSGTPADRGDGWDESAAPGVRTPGEKMILRFTCTHEPCDTDDGSRVTTKTISKKSYQHGACRATLTSRAAAKAQLRPLTRRGARPRTQALYSSSVSARSCISSRTIWIGSAVGRPTSRIFYLHEERRFGGRATGPTGATCLKWGGESRWPIAEISMAIIFSRQSKAGTRLQQYNLSTE